MFYYLNTFVFLLRPGKFPWDIARSVDVTMPYCLTERQSDTCRCGRWYSSSCVRWSSSCALQQMNKAHSRPAAVGLVCILLCWDAVVELIDFDVVVSRTLSGPGGNQLNPTQKQSSRAGLLMKTLFCWYYLCCCRLSNKGRDLTSVLLLLLHLFYLWMTCCLLVKTW